MGPSDGRRRMFESVGSDPALEAEILRLTQDLRPSVQGLEGVGGDPGLEAIIEKVGRPSLLIFMNQIEVPLADVWKQRLANSQAGLDHAIKATGRVEIKGSGSTHLGTAWMIEDNIAVTNRHVASKFAQVRNGTPQITVNPVTGQPLRVVVDFLAELDNIADFEVDVVEVLYMGNQAAGEPDVAFLRLDPAKPLPAPMKLGKLTHITPRDPEDGVAAIGYPAFDSRNNVADQNRIFGGRYNVKRVAPGLLLERRPDYLAHDCTTLGGNSGSMVLSLKQGAAVGLHFWGDEGVENRAVPIAIVKAMLDRALGRGATDSLISPGGGPTDDDDQDEAPKPVLVDRAGYIATGHLGQNITVPAPKPLDGVENVLTPLTELDANGQQQYELKYHHFSSWMHAERKLPSVTAVNIDGSAALGIKRKRDRWFLDDRISVDAQHGEELYSHNPLDRGHMVRRLDPAWGDDVLARAAVVDTFHFTNCAPQHGSLNQREWLALEDHILESAKTHGFRACVFTGPIFDDDDPEYRGTKLPQAFWKIVVTLHTPDEPGSEPQLASSGYVLSQEEFLTNIEFAFGEFRTFQVPLQRLFRLAKLELHQSVLDADALRDQNEEGADYIPIWSVEDARI